MPCAKCSADFNVFNWKSKCNECKAHYCSKCLKKMEGDAYCDVCEVLVRRPPQRSKLMELKSKDLQQYLNKHSISTYGVVEKQELVELFYKSPIPNGNRKNGKKFGNPLTGSVPNISAKFTTLRNNAEAAFNNINGNAPAAGGGAARTGAGQPQSSYQHPAAPPERRPSAHRNIGNLHVPSTPPPDSASTTRPPSPAETASRVRFASSEHLNASPQQARKCPKLSDFQSVRDLNDLSVKQLKELLALNRVDYTGCVEKAELLEWAKRLWTDSNLRNGDDNSEAAFNNRDENAPTARGGAARTDASQPHSSYQPPTAPENRPFAYRNLGNLNVPSAAPPSDSFTPPPSPTETASRVRFASSEHLNASPQQTKKYPKLSDFKTVQDLNDLTAKQLKELLALNRVDFKGCVERAELLERANRLWTDSNLRKGDETSDTLEDCCKICMDAPLDCVLLECGHIATCTDCGKRLAECPICRQYVTRVVRTFKA